MTSMVRYVSCGTRNSLKVANMLWPQKLRATDLERVECGGEGVLRFFSLSGFSVSTLFWLFLFGFSSFRCMKNNSVLDYSDFEYPLLWYVAEHLFSFLEFSRKEDSATLYPSLRKALAMRNPTTTSTRAYTAKTRRRKT